MELVDLPKSVDIFMYSYKNMFGFFLPHMFVTKIDNMYVRIYFWKNL